MLRGARTHDVAWSAPVKPSQCDACDGIKSNKGQRAPARICGKLLSTQIACPLPSSHLPK